MFRAKKTDISLRKNSSLDEKIINNLPKFAENSKIFLKIGFDELKNNPKLKLNLVSFRIDDKNAILITFPAIRGTDIPFQRRDRINYYTVKFSINPLTGLLEGSAAFYQHPVTGKIVTSNKTKEIIEKFTCEYPEIVDDMLDSVSWGKELAERTIKRDAYYFPPGKNNSIR